MGFSDTLKSLIGGAVPFLANAIVPGSGGLAKSIIGSVFGVDPNDDASMLAAVKNASPEQWAELQKAEMSHKKALAEISAELDKAFLADRQDARTRDLKLKQAGYHNYRADIMIVVAFISFCFLCYMVNSNDNIKAEVLTIFNVAIGALLKMLGDAFQFEFGSSRGSKEKDLK